MPLLSRSLLAFVRVSPRLSLVRGYAAAAAPASDAAAHHNKDELRLTLSSPAKVRYLMHAYF